ncbi:MAG: heavy metal-binding domain-containing protein [Rhizobiaceae bacterium]|nr:MAG: heavy metal-binding domain-containing protein [Rhizobiaceae bacterium]
MRTVLIAALACLIITPVSAQNTATTPPAIVNEDVGVPVFPYDITDRPYSVIGEVEAGVRKATVFSKSPSQEKIYRELWERASKLGADAVVNAKYGDAHVTAFSWGKANATGTAIKFLPSDAALSTSPGSAVLASTPAN